MRNRPTPLAPIADGRSGVEPPVDVGQQLQIDAVGRAGRLIAVGGELVLEQEELAFQLEIGAPLLGIGIDQHVSAAAIDDKRVAGLHMAQNAPHARDGGNAAAAGDDRGVAGLAAGLGHDAADIDVAERDDLRRQQLIGHDDHRAAEQLSASGLLHRDKCG